MRRSSCSASDPEVTGDELATDLAASGDEAMQNLTSVSQHVSPEGALLFSRAAQHGPSTLMLLRIVLQP